MRKSASGRMMPKPWREVGRQKLVDSDQQPATSDRQPVPRIGIIRDSAFQFYYPENIDALSDGGAEVVFISPLKDRELLEVDALYIRFKETTVTTKHLDEGIAADYDADGCLAGIEVLDAMKRLGDPTVFKQVILEDIALGRP